MGPIRGLRKRKRAGKKAVQIASDGGQKSGDWWDHFSKRITGVIPTSPSLQLSIGSSPNCSIPLVGCGVTAMGPIRGSKKRKRFEKKPMVMASGAGQESGDWWVDFSKRITGPLSLSKELDSFQSVFKISRKSFNYISSLVREDLMAKTANYTFLNGQSLSVDDQVAVALRRLNSGDSLVNVGLSFGLNQSTVSHVTWAFVEAMEERGMKHLRWPNSEELEIIKSRFEKIRGLPNCCGAIDITHIKICMSSSEPSNKVWFDHEKNHSMILQAVVDPDMRFRDIVSGWPGSVNDFQVLSSSGFFKQCDQGMRLNGKKIDLLEGSEVREYIIGDAGFPLLPWLITPYTGKELTDSMSEFNKRHFATRMVVQRALARLKEVWKIVQGELWRPDRHKLPRIILVCCLLHNIIIDLEDEVMDEMPLSQHHDPSYRQQFCDAADENGSVLREKLSQYLSGTLPP